MNKDLIIKENEIHQVRLDLRQAQSIKDHRKSNKLHRQLTKLNALQLEKIKNILSDSDPKFKAFKDENLKILSECSAAFKVTKSDVNYAYNASYAKKFEGGIRDNGFMYCDSVSVSYQIQDRFKHFWTLFGFKVCPKEYTGTIDCFGRTEFKVTKVSYSFWMPELAREFDSKISIDGTIQIFTTKKTSEIFDNDFIHRIMSEPFASKPKSRERFISNREAMYKFISSFRHSLLN